MRQCGVPPSWPPPATSCCWRPPAPASTNLKTTSTAAASSKRQFTLFPAAVGSPDGQAPTRRPDTIHCHRSSPVRRPGHGVQCVGGGGPGAVWLAVRVFLAAVALGHCRHGSAGRHHEARLSPAQSPGGGFLHLGGDCIASHGGIFSRSLAQHPPLDSL